VAGKYIFVILNLFILKGYVINNLILFLCSQATAFASEDGVLTKEMMLDRTKDAASQHRQKTEWQSDSERSKTFAV